LGIEIQQVSIASLIIALGLLVDDPVVADDAIKSNLALGHPSIVSAWLGATILALFPLALDGGPLWQPLCYAQIGGLALATGIELILVPVFYAFFVLDLKIVKWETNEK